MTGAANAGARPGTAGLQPGETCFREFAVYRGDAMDRGCRLQGPAIVELRETTLVVPSVFAVCLDEAGSFILTRRDGRVAGVG